MSGSNPSNGLFTFTCSGVNCELAANTTYFVVMSTADTNGSNMYRLQFTTSGDEVNQPAGNGWSVADKGRRKQGGNAWADFHWGGGVLLHIAANDKPTLTAGSVTATTAGLSIDNYSGSWHYKYTSPSGGSCSSAQTGATASVSGLDAETTYTFKAYSDAGCTAAYLLATASEFTTTSLTVAASDITRNSATLTLTGWAAADGSWRYKHTSPDGGSCSSAQSGATANLTNLTPDTLHSYTVYSDSDCSKAQKSVTFWTTDYSVGNLDESSSYKCDFGLAGQPEKCATSFTTGSRAHGYRLASVALRFGAKWVVSGTVGDIVVAIHAQDSVNASDPADSSLVTLSGSNPDTAGMYNYTCSGNACDLEPNTTYFVVLSTGDTSGANRGYAWKSTSSTAETKRPSANGWAIGDVGRVKTGAAAWREFYGSSTTGILHIAVSDRPAVLAFGDLASTTASLDISRHTGAWWYKRTAPTGDATCHSVSSGVSSTVSGLTAGTSYTYKAYDKANCAAIDEVASVTFKHTPLTASNVTTTTATINMGGIGQTDAWSYKANIGPDTTCKNAGNPTSNIIGLTVGLTYIYTAYNQNGCVAANFLDSVTFMTGGLSASSVTQTSATLSMSGHTGEWRYKRILPSGDSTCHSVSSGTATASLSDLTPNALYEYTAYSDSTCTTALNTVYFSASDFGVGNIAEAASGSCVVGYSSSASQRCAVGFTTGSRTDGYTLSGVSAEFNAKTGAPGDIVVAIHAADSGNGSNPAVASQVVLTGSDPDTAGTYTYTCSGAGCDLSASATYFVVMSTADSSGSSRHYSLRNTTSDSEVNYPSTNGWAIANAARIKSGSSSWSDSGQSGTGSLHIAANNAASRLAASRVTATTATLDIARHTTAWWYKRTAPTGDDACHSVASGTSSASLSGLVSGTTYTYKAYSKTGCNAVDELASHTFTPGPLAATDITTNSATLTLPGHSGSWYFKANAAPHTTCSSAQTGPASLTNLTTGATYIYTAYSDASCTSSISSATFTVGALSVTNITSASATLGMGGYTETWAYKRVQPADSACNVVSAGTSTASLTTLTADTLYGYTAYSDNSCSSPLGTIYFSTSDLSVGNLTESLNATQNLEVGSGASAQKVSVPFTTGSSAVNYALRNVSLMFGAKVGSPGNLTVALHSTSDGNTTDTVLATLTGASSPGSGLHTYTCAGNGCALSANTTYAVVMSVTGTSGENYYPLRITASSDEYKIPGASGWSIADKSQTSTAGATWADATTGVGMTHIAADDTEATLRASGISRDAATLEIENVSGNWHYKANTGAHASCSTSATVGAKVDLTGLTPGAWYTYTAYSDSSCLTALKSVSFATADVTASNLSQTGSVASPCQASKDKSCYTGFTTGASSTGYMLSSVKARFKAKVGSAGNVVAKLHPEGSTPGRPGTTSLATLTGSNPDTAGDYTYSCAGAGCALEASTTYFILFSSTSDSGGYYGWNFVENDGETLNPASNGWTIANDGGSIDHTNSNAIQTLTSSGYIRVDAYKNPTLTVSNVSSTAATLTISTYAGEWHYKRITPSGDATCNKISAGTSTATLSSLTVGTLYEYTIYRDSGCAISMDSAFFSTTDIGVGNLEEAPASAQTCDIGKGSDRLKCAVAFTTGSGASAFALSGITARFGNKVGSPGALTVAIHANNGGSPASAALATLTGSDPSAAGLHTYACSGVACRLSASTTYFIVMSVASTTGNNYYPLVLTSSSSEYNMPSASGWSIADLAQTATSGTWSDATGTGLMHVAANNTTANLAVSDIGRTSATLAISNYTGNWRYKANKTPHNTCSSAQSGTTVSLTGLTAGTSYTYSVYGDGTCTTALNSIKFMTADVSVSNLTTTPQGTHTCTISQTAKCYTGFTTGSSSEGYLLSGITANLKIGTGTPGDIVATLHADSSGQPAASALATLTGSNPSTTTASDYTYSCSGANCALEASTTYFAVFTIATSASVGDYSWALVDSDEQTSTPSSNGWTIADGSGSVGGSNPTYLQSGRMKAAAYTNPSLTVSGISGTGATLTISTYAGEWHYKRITPAGDATCNSVSAGTSTASLSALTAGTLYEYAIYRDGGCGIAMDSASFSTTDFGVGNLDESENLFCGFSTAKCAASFTTGSRTGGYTLSGITARFNATEGSYSNNIVVAVHAANGDDPADSALVTLSGSNPTSAGLYSFACSGRACDLAPSTTYFVVMSADGSGNTYKWTATNSGRRDESIPTNNGWSISNCHEVPHDAEYLGPLSPIPSGGTGMLHIAASDAVTRLTASSVTASGATLTLTEHTGNWWLKRTTPADATCKSKGTTATETLTDLSPGASYTYKAYSDSTCTTEIASETFSAAASLTASAIGISGATLTLSGHTTNWWLKRTTPADSTCKSKGTTITESLTSLTPRKSYTYKAYSDSTCATEIASETFKTEGLTVSNITSTTATLTLTGHTGTWYYKRNAPSASSCTTVSVGNVVSLTDLTAGALYGYTAYSDNGCSTKLDADYFSAGAAYDMGNMIATPNTDANDKCSFGNLIGTFYTKCGVRFSTGGRIGGYTVNSVSVKIDTVPYQPGDIVVAIHADNNGNPASSPTVTLTGANPTTDGGIYTYTCTGVACDLAADTDYFVALSSPSSKNANYYRLATTFSDDEHGHPADNGWSIANSMKDTNFSGVWRDKGGSATGIIHIAAENATTRLLTSNLTATGARISIGKHTGNWHYKADTGPDNVCKGPVTDNYKDLTGLTSGTTYTYTAYSDATCATKLASATFKYGLSAKNITGSGATLSIAGHTSAWYYKRVQPADATCHSVSAGVDVNLSNLTANTLYGYTAYSDSGCSTELNTVYFAASKYGVGNLAETAASTCKAGVEDGVVKKCAVEFSTGGKTGGYAISGLSARFGDKTGNPSSLIVAIHEADTANSSNPAATDKITLTGSAPNTAGIHAYTCAGNGCNLSANTKYFVVMSTGDEASTHHYNLRTTGSDREHNHPATNGWALADVMRTKSGSSAWADLSASGTALLHIVANDQPPVLTASGVASASATLNLGKHAGTWHYKRVYPTSAASCTEVSSGYTVSLTELTGNTLYGYAAYGDNSCSTELDSVYFSTSDYGVGNINEATSTECLPGVATSIQNRCAMGFTTGSRTDGYTLRSLSLEFGAASGSPGDIIVAIHEGDATDSSKPAASAKATLTGANPNTAGIHRFTCSGRACDLDASTTYFIVLSTQDTSGTKLYKWKATLSNDEYRNPANNGWSIADTTLSKLSSLSWQGISQQATGLAHLTIDDAVVTLTISGVAPTSATLNIGNHTAAWWYKRVAPAGSSACQSVAASTTSVNLTTLTAGGSYTYKAYSDSNCANEMADASFTTALNVSNLSQSTSGTANVGQSGSDQILAAGGFSTGSNSGGYTLQSVTVNMASRIGSPASFTAAIHADSGGNPAAAATYTLSGAAVPGAGQNTFTCSGSCALDANTTYYLTLSGTGPSTGSNVFRLNLTSSDAQANTPSGAGWTLADALKSKTNQEGWGDLINGRTLLMKVSAIAKPSLEASGVTMASPTLTISNYTGTWWYKANKSPDNTCKGPVNALTQSISGLTGETSYQYTAYSDAGCTEELASASFSTTAKLTASSVGIASATLTLTKHAAGWWLKRTAPTDGTCKAKSITTESLSSLTPNTSYTYKAYNSSGCASSAIATATFETGGLAVSGVTTNSATLTVSKHSGSWRYKRTAPTGDNTCHAVSAGTSTASLSSLNSDTSYTYTAYSDSSCLSALDSVSFNTQLTVSNLSGSGTSSYNISSGHHFATGFRTGNASSGYTLNSVTARFQNRTGNPGSIIVKLLTNEGSTPQNLPVLATLTGSDPDDAGDYTYTCAGAGCDLDKNTTYHVAFSAQSGTSGNYVWESIADDAETREPSSNGWSIGNSAYEHEPAYYNWVLVSDNKVLLNTSGRMKVTATAK